MSRTALRDASGAFISRDEARLMLLKAGWRKSFAFWLANAYGHNERCTLRQAWAAHLAWLEVKPIGGKL